jgi:hypothetical protein
MSTELSIDRWKVYQAHLVPVRHSSASCLLLLQYMGLLDIPDGLRVQRIERGEPFSG